MHGVALPLSCVFLAAFGLSLANRMELAFGEGPCSAQDCECQLDFPPVQTSHDPCLARVLHSQAVTTLGCCYVPPPEPECADDNPKAGCDAAKRCEFRPAVWTYTNNCDCDIQFSVNGQDLPWQLKKNQSVQYGLPLLQADCASQDDLSWSYYCVGNPNQVIAEGGQTMICEQCPEAGKGQ